MSVWLIAFEKIDFKQIAQTNLSRPLKLTKYFYYRAILQIGGAQLGGGNLYQRSASVKW